MASWLLRLMDSISNHWFEFALPVNQTVDFLSIMYATPSRKEDPETENLVMQAFLDDFRSRTWITYRSNFPSLLDKNGCEVAIYSDAGWGCSVRATQMLVAQSLINLEFGREWRLSGASPAELERYKSIIANFKDDSSAPLSIHQIVSLGHSRFGKRPSEWFGPTTSARAAEELINRASSRIGMASIVFDSGEMYTSEVVGLFNVEKNSKGILVMVSHRLGLDSFNLARYKGTIHSLFSNPFFQGLSSGESMVSAYYFFAACEEYLFYLDPHTVQEAFVDSESIEAVRAAFPSQPKPLRMRWSRLNPSLTMGFVVKSPNEWDQLSQYLSKIDPELFEVFDKRKEPRVDLFISEAESEENEIESDMIFVN